MYKPNLQNLESASLESANLESANLESANLETVTGGAPQVQQPQPIKPAFPNYGAPKYSAAWWDFVRAAGISR